MSADEVYEPAQKKRRRRFPFVRAFLALLLLLAGGYFLWDGFTPEEPDETPTPALEVNRVSPEEAFEISDAHGGDVAVDEELAPAGPYVRTEPLPPINNGGGGSSTFRERTNLLRIPSIHVQAPIRSVGIGARNQMELPANLGHVGWLNTSVNPSFSPEGSTVLAGHVTWQGTHGVLHYLGYVKPGAAIQTWDDTGSMTSWVVTDVEVIRKDALPSQIFAKDGPRRLNIVTCGGRVIQLPDGTWNHESNIVVTAVPRR